ncbi:uncharacterized protein LOC124454712 [Xenia sp. Carnegie-2017]|uniref:uncharacterized protein LOC124454712 n=1 Tax=Xenia sp. Carnegie-2017 TaxID=2897299 RepID=UPI001F03AECC|nr:uncharacterized protein LOC124454712 [Xenia sp. Carnegie-2017]
MDKYLTLDNLQIALKFSGIISTGIFAGGAIFVGSSQLPGILAMTDMDQALINFRYFWPRVRQMPRAAITGSVSGIGAYLIKRKVEDLPWLIGGVGMTFIGAYTLKVVYPKSIAPLLDPDLLKDNDETHVRNTFKKFADYHDVRTYIGTAAFVAFTFAYFKSTYN